MTGGARLLVLAREGRDGIGLSCGHRRKQRDGADDTEDNQTVA
jgi:hypothetical protein